MMTRAGLPLLALLLLSACGGTSAPPPTPALKPSAFRNSVQPLLQKHCYSCHGEKKHKGDLNLAAFTDERSVLAAAPTWKKAWGKLYAREMPPEERPQPTPAEREMLTEWIEATLAGPGGARDPGRVVLRRLTRGEYANTIRDLVGVEAEMTRDFPSDDVGYGFDNIGDVLTLPPLLLEKYMAAAAKILDRAIVAEPPRKPGTHRVEGEQLKVTGDHSIDEGFRILTSNGEASVFLELAQEGDYLFKVRAAGDQAGNEPARMALRVEGKELKVFDVKETRPQARIFEVRFSAKAGRRKFAVAFLNDLYLPDAKNPRERDRNLAVDFLEVLPVDTKPALLPEPHRRVMGARPAEGTAPREAARGILSAFSRRAFRRPVADAEIERLLRLFDLAVKQGDAFEQAVKLPLQAVLVSPHFLFRVELNREGDPMGSHRVGDYELATRLSYFLWSSMPDEELFEEASRGTLGRPEVLERQVRRMLKDPRSRALAENFAVQWLQLRRLESAAPDKKRFPSFDDRLREAMLQEAVLFFGEVLQAGRSAIDLIEADFTYANEILARHYGLPALKGSEMRRVALPDRRRGGVATLGGVLTVNSNATRTSPVLRGKWVLEVLLGTPPPPPPPGAGDLKDEPEETRLTMRQRLERHRSDPTCASCHARMDPIGFAFENFDGIGAWRDKEGTVPVDASGTLPDGKSFRGPLELKDLLLSRKDDFLRCLTEKIMTYALGRGVEYYDARAMKEVRVALAKDGYRLSTLVLEIVKSYPFQHRRNRSVEKNG